MNKVSSSLPSSLAAIRSMVAAAIPESTESFDRRGFRLLQWPSPRTQRKPVELSLEHEARLRPKTPRATERLLTALASGRLAGGKDFGELNVAAYQRPGGPQSVDLYYDPAIHGRSVGLLERGFTFRERIASQSFMTWGDDNQDGLLPLNLELPFVSLSDSGVTARLEFNWLDDLSTSLLDTQSGEPHQQIRSPLFLAIRASGVEFTELLPVIAHTTTRNKFSVHRDEQLFAINVDFVMAKQLQTLRTTRYIDVDISGIRPVDDDELDRLLKFTQLIAAEYDLEPNQHTKATVTSWETKWRPICHNELRRRVI